jgi:sugar-specific transcriptional regulator TrmB
MEAEPIDVEDYLDAMEKDIQEKSQIALEAVDAALAESKQKSDPKLKRFKTYKNILLKWQEEYPTHFEMTVFERMTRLKDFFKLCKQAQQQG